MTGDEEANSVLAVATAAFVNDGAREPDSPRLERPEDIPERLQAAVPSQ
jgi:hypothetical protein